MQQCTRERMSQEKTGSLHVKYHLTPNLLHLLLVEWEEEDGARGQAIVPPFGVYWWTKMCHLINTSRQSLFPSLYLFVSKNQRGNVVRLLKSTDIQWAIKLTEQNHVRDNNWRPPSSSFFAPSVLSITKLSQFCMISVHLMGDLAAGSSVCSGMQGSGQENSLFMIQQRLWACADPVANWKMNENWQVSQGNQSNTIGFQYENAREMITWKQLQSISDFFPILRHNGLVCPLGLTTCIISKGKSTRNWRKSKFHGYLLRLWDMA